MPLAVILDMDGLMLDTEPIAHRAFRHAAGVVGCAFGDELFHRLLGLNAAGARELLRSHYGDAFRLDEFIDAVARHYDASLHADGVPHKPGLIPFLEFLNARSVPRAVATSTATAIATDLLERAGVRHHLHIIVGGDQVERGKPAPDIFLAAAARLGCRPEECLVLEDSGPGIRAAAAAGMRPILVPDGVEPLPEVRRLAYAVVGSLADAQAVIEELLQKPGRTN